MSSPHSAKELTTILNLALDALEKGRREHVYRRSGEPWHLANNLERLDACCPDFQIQTEEDYWEIILDCLETALSSPLLYYKQPQQPICSHQEAENLEMFAFVVPLEDFTREIYTKFCLNELSDGTWYISIDCHT